MLASAGIAAGGRHDAALAGVDHAGASRSEAGVDDASGRRGHRRCPLPRPPIASAEVRKSAAAAALAAAKKTSSPDIGNLSVDSVEIARDSSGTWWAEVVVRSSRQDVDSLPVYLKRTGSSWAIVDMGTGVEPGSDDRFPSEVRDKL